MILDIGQVIKDTWGLITTYPFALSLMVGYLGFVIRTVVFTPGEEPVQASLPVMPTKKVEEAKGADCCDYCGRPDEAGMFCHGCGAPVKRYRNRRTVRSY